MATAELAIEARYLTGEGESVTTSVAGLDGEVLVAGLPVRQVRWHAGGRHYPGLF